MKFGMIPAGEAAGCILAHSVRAGGTLLKKGLRLSPADIAVLQAGGVGGVMAARLGPDDVAENEAAGLIAAMVAGPGTSRVAPFTGRCNINAAAHGVLSIDRDLLIKLNSIDEGLTVATLHPYETVTPDQMIATVKIIPYALPGAVLDQAERLLARSQPLLSINRFGQRSAGLIVTTTPDMKSTLIGKRTDAIARRLQALGSQVGATEITAHAVDAVHVALEQQAAAGLNPLLIFGASAIVDRGDVIPAAIVRAGGVVRHLGMPVDPGNLLLLGSLGTARVIGVPSCASSPKLNGFDWVLARVLAGLDVSHSDFAAMAPGGLLNEIPTRPQPRRGGNPQN